jgi:hypothetical protein
VTEFGNIFFLLELPQSGFVLVLDKHNDMLIDFLPEWQASVTHPSNLPFSEAW